MYILTISDDVNQSFSFNSDNYNTNLVLKCGEDLTCNFSTTPVLDVYVDGYEPILGLPLINGVDILSEHVSAGCLPFDYGAIIALSQDDRRINCRDLVLGNSALVYFSSIDIIYSSLIFPL